MVKDEGVVKRGEGVVEDEGVVKGGPGVPSGRKGVVTESMISDVVDVSTIVWQLGLLPCHYYITLQPWSVLLALRASAALSLQRQQTR